MTPSPMFQTLLVAAATMAHTGPAQAQAQSTPPPFFSEAIGKTAPPPWRYLGLPGDKIAKAQLDIINLDKQKVLRLQANNAYGTLVYAWTGPLTQLRWRWRLEQPVAAANLAAKEGDDVPLKVCVSFDTPLSDLSLTERSKLFLARTLSGEKLPAATLCYVWDQRLPTGSVIANAYTQRVRFIVLDSGTAGLGQWQTHERNVKSDFLNAFGSESRSVPPVVALIVGADSDNTHGSSLGYIGDILTSP